MALDLLAGSVVFQIPHRPNAKLNIRMGFHRSLALKTVNKLCVFLYLSQWPSNGGGCGQQDPQLLHHVRYRCNYHTVYRDLSYGEILTGQPGAWLVKKDFFMHPIKKV